MALTDRLETTAPVLQKLLPGVPLPAALLGLGGLIPFVFFALLALFASGDLAATAQSALRGYGLVILSFLGGVHWGLAIADYGVQSSDRRAYGGASWARLGFSVAPSLFAWFALVLPMGLGLFYLALCMVALLGTEMSLGRSGLFPRWYLSLRGILTTGAGLCLALGAFG